ncbi:MAG: cytochrome c oxidase accessory protein CcoG [Caulobacterales bacterium]|nr:cytochrome c oxidase accessory protein CcoG [Caulobacterales bacterium]
MNLETGMAADGVAQVDVAAVNSEAARSLYKARVPIYPKHVYGRFRTLKWVLLTGMLAIYYGLPWLRWPRGAGEPDQAVLVDFAGQRFYFFFIEIWPQEVYYITGLLIVAALSLFLVTALFGRLWCGYACPQTVWTDLYIAVERLVEGDRNKRMRLAKQSWSVDKVTKKAAKHAIWLAIAFATGGAWILYFHDAPTIARDFFLGEAPGSAYLFAGLLTFTTYTLAGMMREQVCTYMCPWPRIQGAMTDGETLEVTYRRDRGEPRGAHKRGDSWEGRGDCIDCRQCVAVCPMGIDIRDGDQLECINCALCIDACDDIMDKVGRPRGLIAYDSGENVTRREAGGANRFRPVRPRTIFYAVALTVVTGVMLFGLLTRTTLDVNVLRDRNPNVVILSDGSARNGYTVKILNKANAERDFRLLIDGPDALSLAIIGQRELADPPVVRVSGDAVGPFRLFLTLPPEALTAPALPIVLTVESVDGVDRSVSATTFQTGARP